ncbi:FAD-dependent oxidoreductase [Salinibacterium sp. G-O1]|uniref:FAD-dependent oxidoreductase n=1 Tax=Salinibacterium sp. G-O1 TaxID=3046208 RepID=UPI0024B9C181|nr:FAD-dependent oxidoreductase [Salinibacterium sp. G-O1]MDJ0333876.1 FAD-dependent oxidoreductase [Salinibacterium sp. G-O1]
MTLIDLTSPMVREDRLDGLPVAIIGAGPIGLAAAAHLAAREVDFVIYEAGQSIAESMASWGHIRLFSPWRHLIDPAARTLLEASGWIQPHNMQTAPTGAELIEKYLAPLAALPQIASRIHTGVRVDAVTRQGMDRTRSTNRATTPFALRITDSDGAIREVTARAVIDASGTYTTTNSLGSNGLEPLGLAEVADHVTHALPNVLGRDRVRFAGKHITVVGAGHSAANTLINLATLIQTEPDTRVTWVIRNKRAERVFTSEDDELTRRASLGAKVKKLMDFGVVEIVDGFEITGLAKTGNQVDISGLRHGNVEHITTDIVVNATGFRPNLDILREIRLDLDEVVEAPVRLAPLIDPNLHTCGTVEPHGFAELEQPEPNFFIAGMKSYGRAPTFLLATGHEQVRSIAAYLAGDLAAASNVELVLPATGVCCTDPGASSPAEPMLLDVTTDKPTVLFVCIHNAGRSQMAAGFMTALSGGAVEVRSGGSEPGDQINPIAIQAMAEEGIDISQGVPQLMTTEQVRDSDVVITMGCGDVCPIFPGKRYEDWALVDPRGKSIEDVRPIRDDIKRRIEELLAELLPATA